MVTGAKMVTGFQWYPFPHMHFLPFPLGLDRRDNRIEVSHNQQTQEQRHSLQEVKEAPGTPPLSPHLKKRHFWGLYHTKKWFLSDLRKRPRCPVWAGDTALNSSTLESPGTSSLGPWLN